jgi:hypothetical protein
VRLDTLELILRMAFWTLEPELLPPVIVLRKKFLDLERGRSWLFDIDESPSFLVESSSGRDPEMRVLCPGFRRALGVASASSCCALQATVLSATIGYLHLSDLREFLWIRFKIGLSGFCLTRLSSKLPSKTLPRVLLVFRTVNGRSAPPGGLPPLSSELAEMPRPPSTSGPAGEQPVTVWQRLTILSGLGFAVSDP